jgi:toluene monooxygenase system protein E
MPPEKELGKRLTLKTYSHLLQERRMPTEYEIVTSSLHYYRRQNRCAFEVDAPLGAWYAERQASSPLACGDWEAFADPRETTYTKYTQLQRSKEIFVDGLLQSIEDSGYDQSLGKEWVDTLGRLLAPLRYPLHGFQMVAAYVGQMAPSGRLTIVALFQAADELRRIQRIAYRMAQLGAVHPGFGAESRALWQEAPEWQPLREGVEKLLVAYDFGEALVGLNLCLKPLIDELFMVQLPHIAREHGDYLLGEIFSSWNEDCRWHRQWTQSLVGMALRDRPRNREVIQLWLEKWMPLAARAALALGPSLGKDAEQRIRALSASSAEYLQSCGLEPPLLFSGCTP